MCFTAKISLLNSPYRQGGGRIYVSAASPTRYPPYHPRCLQFSQPMLIACWSPKKSPSRFRILFTKSLSDRQSTVGPAICEDFSKNIASLLPARPFLEIGLMIDILVNHLIRYFRSFMYRNVNCCHDSLLSGCFYLL